MSSICHEITLHAFITYQIYSHIYCIDLITRLCWFINVMRQHNQYLVFSSLSSSYTHTINTKIVIKYISHNNKIKWKTWMWHLKTTTISIYLLLWGNYSSSKQNINSQTSFSNSIIQISHLIMHSKYYSHCQILSMLYVSLHKCLLGCCLCLFCSFVVYS